MAPLRPIATTVALLLAASTAAAQTNTWNLTDQVAPGACAISGGSTVSGATGIGNVDNCTAQPNGTKTSLTIHAYNINGTTTGSSVAAAAITGPYGTYGIGVGSVSEGGLLASTTNGAHSMDNNSGGGSDMLLLQFLAGPQVLRSVTLGWYDTDSDWQLLRWTGALAPSLPGQTVTQMLAGGWQLVGAYNGLGATTYNVNANSLSSQYWMVAAYNPALGTTNGFTVDAYSDRMKVSAVTATATPEPSTYLLLGSGMLGLLAIARRRRTA